MLDRVRGGGMGWVCEGPWALSKGRSGSLFLPFVVGIGVGFVVLLRCSLVAG